MNNKCILLLLLLLLLLSCVWSPSNVGLIRKIEAVQKRFTERLPGLNFLDYHERLALLGLESLELRRLKADLCMTYKIMFNLVDLNVDNFLQLELTKLHMAIHALSLNHSVKFVPVVTSLHVEWLILGTT